MVSRISGALPVGSLVAALTLAFPGYADSIGSKHTAKAGRAAGHHGAAIRHGGARNLPKGINIFRIETRTLPDGVKIFHRHRVVSSRNFGKPRKRKHTGGARVRKIHNSIPPDKRREKKMSKITHNRVAVKHRAKKKLTHVVKNHVVYAATVKASAPGDEYIYPAHKGEEKCRHLTERGYDISGRRVLVEWTLCLDEHGKAYVPTDGRRIVARF